MFVAFQQPNTNEPAFRRAAENELPAARDCWSDKDIVFGESFGAFESFVEFHHLLLWNDDSNRVITVELHDGGMLSLPCHALGVRVQKGVRNRLLTSDRDLGIRVTWEDQNDQLLGVGIIMY